jgi:Flp pilus assembly protein TadG
MTSVHNENERGQAFVLMTLSLVVLVGMAALVLDVGAWFQTKRHLQGTADAAALAGAQDLPETPSVAKATAADYASRNGGDVLGADISITSSPAGANDTISVKAAKSKPGIFSGVLGIGGANIDAHARARVGPPVEVLHVAPMTVFCDHDLVHNCDGETKPTFGVMTHLDFDKEGAPGAFGMLNLSGGSGTPGSSEEAEWILRGFNKLLKPGIYRSDPGAKFESSNIQSALDARIGSVLLFPVYKTLTGEGQNAEYDIIGWIGFHLTSYEVHGHNVSIEGYFTTFIATGILAGSGGGAPGSGPSSSWGVKSIQLIE